MLPRPQNICANQKPPSPREVARSAGGSFPSRTASLLAAPHSRGGLPSRDLKRAARRRVPNAKLHRTASAVRQKRTVPRASSWKLLPKGNQGTFFGGLVSEQTNCAAQRWGISEDRDRDNALAGAALRRLSGITFLAVRKIDLFRLACGQPPSPEGEGFWGGANRNCAHRPKPAAMGARCP